MITNADTGILLSWMDDQPHMAILNGTGVSVVNGPEVVPRHAVSPMLQAQDGSFVGTTSDDNGSEYMVGFDATGGVLWTVPNETPVMATADGGVIGQSGIVYDQNGGATGQIGNMLTQAWTFNMYRLLGSVDQVLLTPAAAAFTFATFAGPTYVIPHATPQEALYNLSTANLTARPQCDALLAQFASMAHEPEATLIAQIKVAANAARDYVYDGPSADKTVLDPVKFPEAASPGVTTVAGWFALRSNQVDYADGLSQVNGSAVWFRLDDWHSWFGGYLSAFLINSTGGINYYGMGTVMHEILHKYTVGGGFRHEDMDKAIKNVGWPQLKLGHNNDSQAIGQFCFGDLQ